MAIDFTDTTPGYVDHGSLASVDDLDNQTWIFWINPNDITLTGRRLVFKGTGLLQIFFNRTTAAEDGQIDYSRARATTSTRVRSVANTFANGVWGFVAVTDGASVAPRIYKGSLTALAAETAYHTQTTGVGAPTTDAASPLAIGARVASVNTNINARVGLVWVYNRILTLGEILEHQFSPMYHTNGCVLKVHYFSTTYLRDLSGSGNHGTLVATPINGAGPPLTAPFFASSGLTPYKVASTQFLNADGSVSPAGSLTLQVNKAYAGVTGPNGQPIAGVQTSLAGAVSPTGSLATQVVTMLSVSGSISPTGALVKQVNSFVTASTGPTSTLVKQVNTSYTGVTGPGGQPILGAQTTLSGTLASSSVLTNQQVSPLTLLSVSGAISPVGVLTLVYVPGLTQDTCVSDYNMIEPTEVAATDLPTSKVHLTPSTV